MGASRPQPHKCECTIAVSIRTFTSTSTTIPATTTLLTSPSFPHHHHPPYLNHKDVVAAQPRENLHWGGGQLLKVVGVSLGGVVLALKGWEALTLSPHILLL